MFKRVKCLSVAVVSLLLVACISSARLFGRKASSASVSNLSPEFFQKCRRIAVQDFYFADGLETNAFSPTDSAFLRSVIESKIVQCSSLEVVTRKDEEILLKEKRYHSGATEVAGDPPAGRELKLDLGADAFVHGVIYEYRQARKKLRMTVAVKVISTEDGHLWQSDIINAESKEGKFELFEKLGTMVGQRLSSPASNRQQIPRRK